MTEIVINAPILVYTKAQKELSPFLCVSYHLILDREIKDVED
jgi:hypothetical protein